MKSSFYICPVCGFDGLKEEPYDKLGSPSYEICLCCGFEFGVEKQCDMIRFREDWIRKGSPWFTPELRPRDWDSRKQLARIG